jgi:hypothetical protein
MSGHTPGPWQVVVEDQTGIGRSHAVYICDASGWPEGQLARVNVQDGLGEREANARLIAAAPDLYGALLNLLSVQDGDAEHRENAEAWAIRALAKARGEQA